MVRAETKTKKKKTHKMFGRLFYFLFNAEIIRKSSCYGFRVQAIDSTASWFVIKFPIHTERTLLTISFLALYWFLFCFCSPSSLTSLLPPIWLWLLLKSNPYWMHFSVKDRNFQGFLLGVYVYAFFCSCSSSHYGSFRHCN